MKKLTLLFIFFISTHSAISQTVLSSCLAPDSVTALYIDDADRLALTRIYQQNVNYIDSVVIPQSYTDTLLRALIAVYNATALPARNTVVSIYNIHTFPYPIMNRLYVAADSNLSWTQQLKLGNIQTGNTSVDNLISTYSLSIQNYNPYFGLFSYHLITFKSDSNYNIPPLTDYFENIPGVVYSETVGVVGDGMNIAASIHPNHVELTYSIGWGDCFAGCIYEHFWKFNVYYDCSVEYLGEYGTPIPIVPTPTISVVGSACTNKTLTIVISGANTGSLNNQPISTMQFNLSSSTPTTYVVLATNNGYPSSASTSTSISIIDCAAPVISVSGSNCINDTLTVSISGANSYSLNNQPIFTPQFTLSSPNSSSYIILASNSTYSASKVISIIDCNNITSIDENKLHQNFSIYPNPANEILNIESDINGKTEIQIFDMLGKEMLSIKNTKQINISTLPRGIYFIKAGNEIKKFTKE